MCDEVVGVCWGSILNPFGHKSQGKALGFFWGFLDSYRQLGLVLWKKPTIDHTWGIPEVSCGEDGRRQAGRRRNGTKAGSTLNSRSGHSPNSILYSLLQSRISVKKCIFYKHSYKHTVWLFASVVFLRHRLTLLMMSLYLKGSILCMCSQSLSRVWDEEIA